MKSEKEVNAVNSSGQTTDSSCKSIMGSNLVLNLVISGATNQVWSLLESLQQAQFIRLFKVKTPGNVVYFSNTFQDVTSMKLVDTEQILNQMTYIPEQEPLSSNFASAGIDSNLIIVNSQSFLLLFSIQISITIPYVLLLIIGKCSDRVSRLGHRV